MSSANVPTRPFQSPRSRRVLDEIGRRLSALFESDGRPGVSAPPALAIPARPVTSGFALEARLAGAILLPGLLHLDGLVAAGRFLRSDDPSDLSRDLPLDRVGRCYAASAALVEVEARGATLGPATRLKWARAVYSEADANNGPTPPAAPNRRFALGPLLRPRGRPHLPPRSGRIVACWWTARGDAEACFDAVRHLRHLGATAPGSDGAVLEWRLHQVKDGEEVGIRDARGGPLRAIPLEQWEAAFGVDGAAAKLAAVGIRRPFPPYWESADATTCIMPSHEQTIMTRQEIVAALGVTG